MKHHSHMDAGLCISGIRGIENESILIQYC